MNKLSEKQREIQIAAINRVVKSVGGRTALSKVVSKNTGEDFKAYRIDDYLKQSMPPPGAWALYIAADRRVPLHLLDPLNYDKKKVRPV